MIYREIPKFIIKRNMQKSAQKGIYFNDLVTASVMRQICIDIIGREDYEVEFVNTPVSLTGQITAFTSIDDIIRARRENGLWMCQNHHKMFDANILLLSFSGKVTVAPDLSEEDKRYVKSVTTVADLPLHLVTSKYQFYIRKRYESA